MVYWNIILTIAVLYLIFWPKKIKLVKEGDRILVKNRKGEILINLGK